MRGALDTYLDNVTAEIRAATQSLVEGASTVEEWRGRMEIALKDGHTAAGAIAAGGWQQATPADWAEVGRRVKFQYGKLAEFARELENGLPLDGSVVARAEMYGISATATYEAVLRRDDIANGYDLERRILHSENSCRECVTYARRGPIKHAGRYWHPAGTLPGIGERCSCLSNCRCTFERAKSWASSNRNRTLTATFGELMDFLSSYATFARGGGAGRRARKAKKAAASASGGATPGNCGTGKGGFGKGNSCWAGGGGGSKPATVGAVTAKARADAKADKGFRAKVKVEAGPPRNAKEQALLEKAQSKGGDAIVRTEKLGAYKVQDGPATRFYHGDKVAVTVLPTKDVPTVKPHLTDKQGYDPADHARTSSSKYTVVDHQGVVSGHPTRAKAEAVARDRITRQRAAHIEDDAEYKIVKSHKTSNLIDGTDLGSQRNAVVTIRVLRPRKKSADAAAPSQLSHGHPCGCEGDCRCKDEAATMTTATFDEARCRRRARLAAARDGVDAAPIRFLDSAIMTDERAITLINRAAGTDLTADDVYIHFIEAANTRFIGDRFMFLDRSTLKNIAAQAKSGIAFMNSHRTGGLSSPSELPFGRTFAGKYEESPDGQGGMLGRTVLGIYMLKGVHPNGQLGPSTDDLHRSIEAGTLSDVSMGLSGGMRLCDVCGMDLSARDESGEAVCPHAPGTHARMDFGHIDAQSARGVKDGKASYTLVDAMPQEVSAVYKGAVPGAGFRKAVALSRSGALSAVQLGEARESYAGLLDRDDRTFSPTRRAFHLGANMDILKAFKFWQAAGEPDEINFESLASLPGGRQVEGASTSVKLEDTPEFRTALAAKLAETQRTTRLEGYQREAATFADAEIAAKRLVPADRDSLVRLFVELATLDAEWPLSTEGDPVPSRVDEFKRFHSRLQPHNLTTEEVGTEPVLPPGGKAISNGVEAPDTEAARVARHRELLAATPLGKTLADAN